MSDTKTPNEQHLETGRINQKSRTRAALLAAGLAMIRGGHQPSVDEVAQATGISKRTAYRYFRSREHMLADAALEALRPEMSQILSYVKGAEVGERLESLIHVLHRLTIAYEPELRTMIRFALDSALNPASKIPGQARGQRRVDWIVQALAPIREQLPAVDYERLVSAMCVCVGIDSFLVLRDIRALPESQVEDVVLWMARALLKSTFPR